MSEQSSATMTEIIAEFKVTRWDETPYDEPAEGPKLTRVEVDKTFTGLIEGTSVAEILTSQAAKGRGYVGSERFVGTVMGKRGSLVFQHGGLDNGRETPSTFGSIVPGSGTGDLEGYEGLIKFVHDDSGARAIMEVAFPEGR
ncbi:DUF3224 domain-containing protein [Catellatospora vulcania]|uniref:DUF3224 domain-containing protein n=1 Tax=Catellatospora vulcania TaxID=1460450 RepID=UPI001E595500|nr:DUF3224 domain-containing protein [Catellatospora vulcania]